MADHKIERGRSYAILVKDANQKKLRILKDLMFRFFSATEPVCMVLSGQHYEVVPLEELSGNIAYIIENVWED